MTRTRALLAALAATSLLLAACGDDDSSSDDPTIEIEDGSDESTDDTTDESTDDEATDDAVGEDDLNVCNLFTVPEGLIDEINELTGEAFEDTEQTESDTCQLTDADDTALLQLSVNVLGDDETSESFATDQSEACDAGSEVEIDVTTYAEDGFACTIEGEAALLAVADGAAALLIAHPSDPTLTSEQVITVLDQVMQLLTSS